MKISFPTGAVYLAVFLIMALVPAADAAKITSVRGKRPSEEQRKLKSKDKESSAKKSKSALDCAQFDVLFGVLEENTLANAKDLATAIDAQILLLEEQKGLAATKDSLIADQLVLTAAQAKLTNLMQEADTAQAEFEERQALAAKATEVEEETKDNLVDAMDELNEQCVQP
jgi:hypothetical protein